MPIYIYIIFLYIIKVLNEEFCKYKLIFNISKKYYSIENLQYLIKCIYFIKVDSIGILFISHFENIKYIIFHLNLL